MKRAFQTETGMTTPRLVEDAPPTEGRPQLWEDAISARPINQLVRA